MVFEPGITQPPEGKIYPRWWYVIPLNLVHPSIFIHFLQVAARTPYRMTILYCANTPTKFNVSHLNLSCIGTSWLEAFAAFDEESIVEAIGRMTTGACICFVFPYRSPDNTFLPELTWQCIRTPRYLTSCTSSRRALIHTCGFVLRD